MIHPCPVCGQLFGHFNGCPETPEPADQPMIDTAPVSLPDASLPPASAARLYRSLGMIANAELMEDLARGDGTAGDVGPGRAGIGRDGENVGVEEQKK
ncbi:MAG TPA: hypothetical protein VMQ76_11805 [Terracidiphilus sp.]|nr:hypothetical protein [Terracidiphilus sp.]